MIRRLAPPAFALAAAGVEPTDELLLTWAGGLLHASWWGSEVSARDLEALAALLRPKKSKLRMVIRTEGWVTREVFRDTEAAARRVLEARGLTVDTPRPLRFREWPDSLDQGPSPHIDKVVAAVAAHRGVIDGAFLKACDAARCLHHVILLTAEEDEGPLTFRLIGAHIANYFDRAWAEAALGSQVNESLPDGSYSAWCARSYRDALRSGKPLRSRCDVLEAEHALGPLLNRVQYERAILPGRLADGRPALIVSTAVLPALTPLAA